MTGIFFIASLESKRLEQKHLINVKGKYIIEWLYERFLYEFKQEVENENIKLIITTGNFDVNKGLEKTIKNRTDVITGAARLCIAIFMKRCTSRLYNVPSPTQFTVAI